MHEICSVPRTQMDRLKILRSSNDSSTAFATIIPTLTDPRNDSDSANVVEYPSSKEGVVADRIKVIPFGAGSDTDTFDMRLWAWDFLKETGTLGGIWIPTLLCDVSLALSTPVGIASHKPVNTDRFVDSVTINHGDDNVNIRELSSAENLISYFVIDMEGAELLQFDFDMTGATNGNCLYKFF